MEIITEAIAKHCRLAFSLDGQIRFVEPHLLGRRGGELLLVAYQIDGHSTRPLPAWRHFEVDRLRDVVLLDDHFSVRADFSAADDGHWEEIIARA